MKKFEAIKYFELTSANRFFQDVELRIENGIIQACWVPKKYKQKLALVENLCITLSVEEYLAQVESKNGLLAYA